MTKRAKTKPLNQVDEKLFGLRMWREQYARLDLDLLVYGIRRYLNGGKRQVLARRIRELRTTRRTLATL
jgi:hypothetical protein